MVKPFFLLVFLALGAVAFVGCDSNDDGETPFGMWRATEFPDDDETDAVTTAYFDISEDEIVAYILFEAPDFPDFESCYFIQSAEVISRDGDRWEIEDVDGERFTSTFRFDGDDLVVIDDDDTIRFERSNIDPSTLTPECPGGERQPQFLVR